MLFEKDHTILGRDCEPVIWTRIVRTDGACWTERGGRCGGAASAGRTVVCCLALLMVLAFLFCTSSVRLAL